MNYLPIVKMENEKEKKRMEKKKERDLQKGGYSIVFLMTHWPITDKMERLSSRPSWVLFSQFPLNVNQEGFTTFQGSKVHDIEC